MVASYVSEVNSRSHSGLVTNYTGGMALPRQVFGQGCMTWAEPECCAITKAELSFPGQRYDELAARSIVPIDKVAGRLDCKDDTLHGQKRGQLRQKDSCGAPGCRS